MYENVKLRGDPLVADVLLFGLPPITVICGPNSSGKTTFLGKLADEKVSVPGMRLESEHVDALVRVADQGAGWAGQPQRLETSLFRAQMAAAASSRRAWFIDEGDEFVQDFLERYKAEGRLAKWQYNQRYLPSAYSALRFPKPPRVALLPPKRNLESSTGVDSNVAVEPHGAGLTNVLFKAKNQPADSKTHELFVRIADAFRLISHGFEFEVFLGASNMLEVRFRAPEGTWLPAPQCGMGLQDLLIIVYFALVDDYPVVGIEEPESHLHPDWQRRLLVFLRDLQSKRFLITTHSNVFLNNALVEKVLVTRFEDGRIHVDDATSRASVLDDLGYSVSDNLVSDLVILVEGPTDVPVLEELFVKRDLTGRFDIKIWPLGGDIMDQLDLTVLSQAYDLVALLDADPGSSKARKRFATNCQAAGIQLFTLDRYAIENYFTSRALREVFGDAVPEDFTVAPRKKLSSQLGFNVKNNNRCVFRSNPSTDSGAFRPPVPEQGVHRFR